MSIVVNYKDTVYGLIDGKKNYFSKSILNMDFLRELNIKTARYTNDDNYNAFPYCATYSTYMFTMYSYGAGHANSDGQMLARVSLDSEGTPEQVEFVNNSTPTVFDLSLLEGVLLDGHSLTFKIWTITNNGGTLSVTTLAPVNNGGIDYNHWGEVVVTGGVNYRTAYSYVSGNYNAALLKSLDNGVTWTFESTIASGTGVGDHIYNEAALFYIGSGDFVAIIRDDDDTVTDGSLYISKSLDYGATWSAPTILRDSEGEYIRGRQPKLTRVTIGGSATYMALTIGKRNGGSGSYGGRDIYFGDRTGIQMYISSDYGDTEGNWGQPTMLDMFNSTDGGQPWAVWNNTANKLFVPYYARKSDDAEPSVFTLSLKLDGLEL